MGLRLRLVRICDAEWCCQTNEAKLSCVVCGRDYCGKCAATGCFYYEVKGPRSNYVGKNYLDTVIVACIGCVADGRSTDRLVVALQNYKRGEQYCHQESHRQEEQMSRLRAEVRVELEKRSPEKCTKPG